MSDPQNKADSLAVGISLMCSVHCLAMPLLVVALPVLSDWFIADEAFHLWLVFAVLPISIYALFNGKKSHGDNAPLLIGFAGLAILVFAVLGGHDLLGEMGEKLFTVIGSCAVAAGHIWNSKIRHGVMA